MLVLFSQINDGLLQRIFEELGDQFGSINGLLEQATELIIFLFYQALWQNVGQTETVLATGCAAMFAGMFGLLLFFGGGLYDTFVEFQRPVKIGPTFKQVTAPSASNVYLRLVGFFLATVGIFWVSWHLTVSALLPYGHYTSQFQ